MRLGSNRYLFVEGDDNVILSFGRVSVNPLLVISDQ